MQVEEGWWSGMFNSKSGLFPSNFVKELDPTKEDGDSNDTTADETGETQAANECCSFLVETLDGALQLNVAANLKRAQSKEGALFSLSL